MGRASGSGAEGWQVGVTNSRCGVLKFLEGRGAPKGDVFVFSCVTDEDAHYSSITFEVRVYSLLRRETRATRG